MLLWDGNKSDDKMLNDLRVRALAQWQDEIMHWKEDYSNSLFETGVHLSRIDSETGYDDFDPHDMPEEESDLEHARR
jgi:hypothetical protein